MKLIHLIDETHVTRYIFVSICRKFGDYLVTREAGDVTCPDCLKLLEARNGV